MERENKNKRSPFGFDQRKWVCWRPKVWWFEIKTIAAGFDVERECVCVYVWDSDT